MRLVHGPGFDTSKLDAGLDPAVGGPDTCVVIVDTATGAELYRYGDHAVCNRPLAPCATFYAPMALIGLDDGKVRLGEVWRWDGSAQPTALWRQDADLGQAFQTGAPWWWRKLAADIGPQRFAERLTAFGYGQGRAVGDPLAFWQGPAAGGGLFLSSNNQAAFLRRLYRGELPGVSAQAAASMQGLMVEERRGDAVVSGLYGYCSSIADNSRNVGWWAGRLKSGKRDVIFAISIEGLNALPGLEIRRRAEPVFTAAGLLPASTG